ncbi:MAG: DUF3391 domain-containing protein [Proteobacteria bacterium]|nr:DUF3391 domain-containing protein [Pseudomonadota bacterium]
MTPPESHVAADHIVKLDCDDLLPGMYICELDRAWSDTPFQIDGFHLKTAEDIQLVLKFCQFVYIDTNRGAKPQKMKRDQLTILSSARKATPVSASVKVERDTYPITHSIKQQLDKARKSYHSIKLELDAQALAIRQRAGKARSAVGGEAESQNLNIALLDQQLLRLIDTIVANPQALIWILNTESVASIAKQHANYCVRAAIWAGILARQLGMSKSDMKVLFQGTLLADIGMNLLPQRLVSKRGPFRRKEFLAYVKHVEFGLEILSGQAALDNRVAGIVRCHHERHDGLGFPAGIGGKKIPALARIANLAYCYERLLRIHSRQRVSPAKAMSRLYKQRELKFSQQLVAEFIQVMGIYPVGTVVALASGEQALILEQNPHEKLSPKIAIVTDTDQAVLKKASIVDLAKQEYATTDRIITGAPAPSRTRVNSSKYAQSFFGKKIGVGRFSFRL